MYVYYIWYLKFSTKSIKILTSLRQYLWQVSIHGNVKHFYIIEIRCNVLILSLLETSFKTNIYPAIR